MTKAPLLLLLLGVCKAGAAEVPAAATPFETNCFDGIVDTVRADTIQVRRRMAAVDSFVYPSYVRVGGNVRIGDRDLPCVHRSRLVWQDDSILRFQYSPQRDLDPFPGAGIPWLSLGTGIGLQASVATSGALVEAMNRAVDSSRASVMQTQASLSFELSIKRTLGYRHSIGLAGSCYIPGSSRDAIRLPYEESGRTLFAEFMPSRWFHSLPPLGLRYGYSWLSGSLGLASDSLRSGMLGYTGHARVHVETGGHAQEFSVVLGEEYELMLTLSRREIERGDAVLLRSWNLGIGYGARL